ncbi:LacI family DNA-binding transcriptional regulator [Cohnella ginsengisoli]|uniref:LacI family DNA-binding transcriptional regulator n=1 Tax=Cohnella ginsengisoli TaxID=425004 RepID=A0A9X4QKY0_9BACL|nr:LacI family DNA-binding transcriptional regulator [Cohnella ginsengisoli]MDG0789920.1 LacI family DNA-binding transcriptional regulator [Cohnella ginsengisoli]
MKMEDIARLAGVSKAAVSLAFSGKPGIGDETRARILSVAGKAGYKPRKSVQAQEAATIADAAVEEASPALLFLVIANAGIVTSQYDRQPFFRELIHFLEQGSRAGGFSLLISAIDMARFDEDLRAIADMHSDRGVILLGTNLNKETLSRIAERLHKLIVLDTCFETLPIPFVYTNNVLGGYQAGTWLCRSGHRSIGYAASDVRIPNFDARRRGFDDAMREWSIAVSSEHEFSVDPMAPAAQAVFRDRIEKMQSAGKPLPTAIFCESDFIAIGVIKSLAELGVRVPEDVSVVGFDDIAEAVIVSPELTTVRVDKEKMVRSAVRLATSLDDSPSEGGMNISVATALIERRSSAAPPSV